MAEACDMTFDISKARIFIRPGYTDLRKAVNGLSAMAEQQMAGEPFSGNIYLFCNRGRKLLKALWWDRNGFWLSHRTLWVRNGLRKTSSPGLRRMRKRGN